MSEIISGLPELPAGVVDMLIGNREAGNLLVTSPDVPVISFTGSTVTGRTISANAAQHLKRLALNWAVRRPPEKNSCHLTSKQCRKFLWSLAIAHD